jgi:hypothetical protein
MITVKHDEPSAPVKLCEQLKASHASTYLGAIFVFPQFVTVAAFDIDITRVVIGLQRRVADVFIFCEIIAQVANAPVAIAHEDNFCPVVKQKSG